MDSFNLLLQKFDSILKEYNINNYRKLKNPLDDKEIDSYLKELKVTDLNFKLFYSWKNGNEIDDLWNIRCQVFDFGSMITLNSIIKLRNKPDLYWNNFFIPIIATGDGDYLLYNNNDEANDYGKLHLFSPSLLFIEEPVSYYDSIFSLLETTMEAYKRSILKYDTKENWLDIDIKKYHEVAKRINVKSKYWTLLK